MMRWASSGEIWVTSSFNGPVAGLAWGDKKARGVILFCLQWESLECFTLGGDRTDLSFLKRAF